MKTFHLATALALAMTAAHAQTDPNKIGFIYVGPTEDFGYNMSMDLGRLHLEEAIEGIETTAFEAVPETAEVERVMERLIQSGHGIIFATSYGYLDYAIRLGETISRGGVPACRRAEDLRTTWAPTGPTAMTACIWPGSSRVT